jgi:hypothetical protein
MGRRARWRTMWSEISEGTCKTGPGDRTGAGLTGDKHSCIGWCHNLHLLEHTAEDGAVPHDVRKMQLTADFIFQIQLLLGEPVFERSDLTIGERVLNRDGHLVGNLDQEIDLVLSKSLLLKSREVQHAKGAVATEEWEKTARLQPLNSPHLVNRGIESTTVNGQVIVKIFLQPNASLDRANAQVTAVSQTALRQLPPGAQPPLILNFSASSVPIL